MVNEEELTNFEHAWGNKEIVCTNAGYYEVYVVDSGTDTEFAKYLGKGFYGGGFFLRPTDNVTITEIISMGVNKILGDPITVSTAGLTVTRKLPRQSKFKIHVPNPNTVLRFTVL